MEAYHPLTWIPTVDQDDRIQLLFEDMDLNFNYVTIMHALATCMVARPHLLLNLRQQLQPVKLGEGS